MNTLFRRGCIVAAFLLILSLSASGQRTGIYSPDRRFWVSGMEAEDNMMLAREIAQIATELEAWVGLPYPSRNTLHIRVQSADSQEDRVIRAQGWEDGRFYQRILAPSPIRMDMEDLLESICSLVLNAYAAPYTPAARRTGLGAETPAWIYTGLLQNVREDLRARNGRWLREELDAGRALSLVKVVQLLQLPDGRWKEKAYAATAVEFLFPAGQAETWTRLFQRIGREEPVTPAWLRENIPTLSGGHVETRWSDFLEQRARVQPALHAGGQNFSIEDRLLELLTFTPQELIPNLTDESATGVIYARDLIALRDAEWVPVAAQQLAMRVRVLAPGAPFDLQPVLAAYARYFDAFRTPPPPKKSRWKFRQKNTTEEDALRELTLTQLWRQAEQAHQQYVTNRQAQTRYVDMFDRQTTESATFLDTPVESSPEQTPIQRYVGEFERLNPR